MNLETEVTIGFFFYVSDRDLRKKKAIKRVRYEHKFREKEHMEILLI